MPPPGTLGSGHPAGLSGKAQAKAEPRLWPKKIWLDCFWLSAISKAANGAALSLKAPLAVGLCCSTSVRAYSRRSRFPAIRSGSAF
jgi:hypothetical protein